MKRFNQLGGILLQRYRNISIAYLLMASQITLLLFEGLHSLELTVRLISSFLLAASLLIARLKKDQHRDYFPSNEVYVQKKTAPKILILGKEFTPSVHENEKDDRFLRISDRSHSAQLWISLFAYSFVTILFFYFLPSKSFVAYPLTAVIGLSLLTRSHGQLLYLPSLGFFYVFCTINWNQQSLPELALLCFTLSWSTFTTFKIIHGLRFSDTHSFNAIKSDAIPLSGFITLLFLIFCFLLPEASPSAHKNEKGHFNQSLPQRLNKSLGRMRVSKRDQRHGENLKNLAKNLKNAKLSPDKLSQYLDQMKKRVDSMGSFIDNLPEVGPSLSSGNKNYLQNTQKFLIEEMQKISSDIPNSKNVSEDQLQKIHSLIDRIEEQSSKLKNLGMTNSFTPKDLENKLQTTMASAFKENLQEEIQNIGDSHFQKRLESENQELFIDKTEAKKDKDASSYDSRIENSIQVLEKQIKQQKKRHNLIPPKQLEKMVSFIKYFLFIALIVLCLRKLHELFTQTEEKGEEGGLTKEERKELLLKKTYATSSEEVRALFQQFSHALQKVYYPDQEEQLPPPKLIKRDFQGQFTKTRKGLNYFLEVFSLSEYRNQTITKAQLTKYRKAYKKLIKNL